jgi:hypothetical protein
MARDNRLWGAERIRGELLKLGIHVSKRTIQKYMRTPRARPSPVSVSIICSSCMKSSFPVSSTPMLPISIERAHQGLKQHVPDPLPSSLHPEAWHGPIKAVPVLGGLYHDYHRVA